MAAGAGETEIGAIGPRAAVEMGSNTAPMLRRRHKPAPASTAIPPAEDGVLDRLFASEREHPARSGATLVPLGTDAFALRVLSARAAVRSLDLQYYIWHSDATGAYLAHEALLAADRGVRVRLLIDDMDARSRDGILMALDLHPQIEIRLFNPFATRSGMLRTLMEVFSRGSRLNHRMHNKAWIADGRIALVGGRNIGDEYFAASRNVNFVDLDVLLAGDVVTEAARSFDAYWNSASALPISRLHRTARNWMTLDEVRQQLHEVLGEREKEEFVQRLQASPRIEDLLTNELALDWSGTVTFVADDPRKPLKQVRELEPGVLQSIYLTFEAAKGELQLMSPYFVPGAGGTSQLRRKSESGVRVIVLTNSLAATDVAAVHAGYSRYRMPLLQAGVQLHELKHAPEEERDDDRHVRIRVGSSKASLHTKAAIVDGRRIFVGSFNLDPRSALLNCEMGVWLDHSRLIQQLTMLFERGVSRQHSYSVTLDGNSRLTWTETIAGHEVVHDRDPHASFGRRALSWLLRHLPIESQL